MRDAGRSGSSNAEVSLEEMTILAREAGSRSRCSSTERSPSGHRPCFLLTEPEESDPKCPSGCGEVHWFTSASGS